MSTSTENSDLQEVFRAVQEHRPPDPEVAKRVHERAEKVRRQILQQGPTDIVNDLIREAREDPRQL